MGYVFDLVKAGVSAGIKLPLGTLLDIPAFGNINIPGVDISLGPLLRIQGDLDLVDVDVFEREKCIPARWGGTPITRR